MPFIYEVKYATFSNINSLKILKNAIEIALNIK